MFSLHETMSYYLYPGYVNMNLGMEKLSELVCSQNGAYPLSGDVYLFVGKKRDMMKLLRWDQDGFILYHKRLEKGTFEIPRFKRDKGWNKIEWKTFMMMMSGISLGSARRRERFRLPHI